MDPVGMFTRIDEWFTYHKATDEQRPLYEGIRASAKALAILIMESTPACADQTAALRKLRECVMTANAAIACKGV